MKLGLVWISNCSGHREGEGEAVCKFPRNPQFFQGIQLPFDFPAVIQRVHIGSLFFKVAVHAAAQLPVLLKGRFIGIKVLFGLVSSKFTDQLVIDQAVLGGDFGGGVFGDPAADRLSFQEQIEDSGLVQQICT